MLVLDCGLSCGRSAEGESKSSQAKGPNLDDTPKSADRRTPKVQPVM